MLQFAVDQKQYDCLCGIRYHIAAKKKAEERGADPADTEQIHKTICSLFDEADALKIPFWVQNTAICSVQDEWRRYLTEYTYQVLEKRGINCDAATTR